MALVKRLYGERAFILLVLLLGIAASSWAAWEYRQYLQQQTVTEFRMAAQDRIKLIAEKVDHNKVVLNSVAAFFRASDSVDRDEFSTFTNQLLNDYPYIRALEWIPHVMAVDRAAYESGAGVDNFTFLEKNEAGDLVPAAMHDEYFPVYYAEPLEANRRIIGFDIFSDLERSEALRRARETRQVTATGRVSLLQIKDQGTPGVIFFDPVFRAVANEKGSQLEMMTGFVGSVVSLGAMIEAALKPLNYAGVNIVLHDLTAERDDQKLLYVRSTRLRHVPDVEIIEDYQSPGALVERSVIDVGGRKWQITILPTRGFFSMKVPLDVYIIFAGGAAFSLLIAYFMLSRARENERISREVDERTMQLLQAKRETEMILMSTQEGVTGLDAAGNIKFCNPTASQLLGYARQDLVGRNHHELLHAKRPDGTVYDVHDCPIQKVLDYGRQCHVENEVFWTRTGDPIEVEYSGAPIFEGGEVAGAVVIFSNIAERRALEKKLEQMARYDSLTGLPNRSLFTEHLKMALARAERSGEKVAVLYLDLNGFKPVNDTLGHAAGDQLLKEFGHCLQEVVRSSDIAARVGGDEFVILADSLTSGDECFHLIERLKKRLEKPFNISGRDFTIGASIGVAFYPDHAADSETLLRYADAAMYRAKKDKSLPWAVHGDTV